MAHGDQPDWADIGRRAERLRRDVDQTLGTTTFSDIRDALGDLVRQEIDATSYSEIFVARLPNSPALSHGVAMQRRRTQLLIKAHRYWVAMTPLERGILWMLSAGAK